MTSRRASIGAGSHEAGGMGSSTFRAARSSASGSARPGTSRTGRTGAPGRSTRLVTSSGPGGGGGDDDPTAANTKETADDLLDDDALNLAFHDLSSRSAVFRARLIEEFQLLDNLSLTGGTALPPQFNTRDVRDPDTLERILSEAPHQLIKFQAFKRTAMDNLGVDRRLTRIRNKDKVPLGAWAGWVVESKVFQNIVLGFIVANAIMVGISAELSDTQQDYVELFQTLDVLDRLSLIVFLLEIALRWTDSFKKYWRDYWNVFDFFVTLGTAVPEVLTLAGVQTDFGTLGTIVRQLRTFRILRALKLAVRFTSLRIIVTTIIEALRSMFLIMTLVFMALFIFAVIGVYAFQPFSQANLPLTYGQSFKTLGSSLEVLFQFLTLDNWSNVVSDLLVVMDPVLTYIYVIVWVWLGAFIFRNVFVGVMVSNFDRISAELRERHAERVKARKMELMRKRLRKELEVAKTNIRTSITNLAEQTRPATASADAAKQRPKSVRAGLTTTTSSPPRARAPSARSTADRGRSMSPSSSRPVSATGGGGGGAPRSRSVDTQPHLSVSPPPPPGLEAMRQPSRTSLSSAAQKMFAHMNNATHSPAVDHTLSPEALVDSIQQLLNQAHGVSKGWEATIRETLSALAAKSEETMWPRDTLFRYFQLMESLQENMREYQELQMMANSVLLELHD
ncbi:Ion transport protein-domain-containing protein [Catenaria anguillulae PL171]|uniref:Ion transport protein-domain-containing protein n=1 Tax=Catenaria anguillulae PL171 TaxID=765915 RepID=A0A1Y2HFL6_9FUNG|nr:Ion transport protein-domain-containing protein [Catenaria anguillulae PL171]